VRPVQGTQVLQGFMRGCKARLIVKNILKIAADRGHDSKVSSPRSVGPRRSDQDSPLTPMSPSLGDYSSKSPRSPSRKTMSPETLAMAVDEVLSKYQDVNSESEDDEVPARVSTSRISTTSYR